MTKRAAWVFVMAACVTTSCGNDDSGSGGCTPNRSVECVGPEQCSGYQECNEEGTAYGGCHCGGTSNGGSGAEITGGTSAGGTSSGGTSSGGTAGDGNAGSSVCEPQDMTGWSPPDYVPPRTAQDVCTPDEIAQYVGEPPCFYGGCDEFDPGGTSEECGACLEPHEIDDSSYGPLLRTTVGSRTSIETNSAGCVHLAGQPECAEAIDALEACKREACQGCPIEDSDTGHWACREEAESGPCADYVEPATCVVTDDCSGSDVFETIAFVFCGID